MKIYIYHANKDHSRAEVATLVSEKMTLKTKINVTRDK